ncbi:MAG: hypothetical protein QM535_20185 [Limnohabitans sp.]|nr:hypothetical protein [Limnohabitans sp.]
MKNKVKIVSLFFWGVLLFSISFQSVHSFEHLLKELVKKHCEHVYDYSNTTISHDHNDFDHCFECEFTLTSFTFSDFIAFDVRHQVQFINAVGFSYVSKSAIKFSSTITPRGPPIFN